jgi:hypothetical protein
MAHEESGLSSARVLDKTRLPQRHLSWNTAKIPRFDRDDIALGNVHIQGEVGAMP